MKNLLLYRLTILDTCAAALAVWAYAHGLITPIFTSDASYLSFAIIGLFVVAKVSLYWRASKVSQALNFSQADCYSNEWMQRKAAKMAAKNEHINDIADWLQILGLLGTVIGFYIAITGLNLDDTSGVVSGLQTAIGTTIVGGFLSLWLKANFRMLDTATSCHLEDVA
jgi:hypothetical protein